MSTAAWMGRAACATNWPTDEHPEAQLRVCLGCPVLTECRQWAQGYSWTGVVIAAWQAPPVRTGSGTCRPGPLRRTA